MDKQKDTYHWWFLSGLSISVIVIFLNYIFNKEPVKQEKVELQVEKQILCPDYVNSEGMKFAGYGKMEIPRRGDRVDIFTWSFDKEKTELYVAKSNARNFANDIEFQYKVVEVYYKDVDNTKPK